MAFERRAPANLFGRGCHTYGNIRGCNRACLREEALACVVANAVPPVLVLSDSVIAGERLVRMFAERGVRDVFDESVVVDARNHSALSHRAAYQTLRLWAAFSGAERRFASGVSTFSKSALLSRGPGAADFVLDTRCFKAHPSDGDFLVGVEESRPVLTRASGGVRGPLYAARTRFCFFCKPRLRKPHSSPPTHTLTDSHTRSFCSLVRLFARLLAQLHTNGCTLATAARHTGHPLPWATAAFAQVTHAAACAHGRNRQFLGSTMHTTQVRSVSLVTVSGVAGAGGVGALCRGGNRFSDGSAVSSPSTSSAQRLLV